MKYLFKAVFEDGTIIQQDERDLSSVNPEKSAFYDVLNAPSKLINFSLSGGDKSISLNFVSQEIDVDGAIIKSSTILLDLRLIYFRRVTLSFPQSYSEIAFNIGWQGNDENGKNHQQILTIR